MNDLFLWFGGFGLILLAEALPARHEVVGPRSYLGPNAQPPVPSTRIVRADGLSYGPRT